jgi:hypothetical protein
MAALHRLDEGQRFVSLGFDPDLAESFLDKQPSAATLRAVSVPHAPIAYFDS